MSDAPQSAAPAAAEAPAAHARIIVFGNEKGGSGKSTAAMHTIVGLLRAKKVVGSIDIDSRQATLTRYLENRTSFTKFRVLDLPMPTAGSARGSADDAADAARFNETLGALTRSCDAVVIDTPGSDAPLSRLAHASADTLVTPMNDSFVDLDILAKVEPETFKVLGPSAYAEMVWEQRKLRMAREGKSLDWLVLRNRLSSTETRNQRNMEKALEELARRIGFRTVPGFGDRVIFREMFLSGLTLLDMREVGTRMTMSHIAARQEVRDMLNALTPAPKAAART